VQNKNTPLGGEKYLSTVLKAPWIRNV